MLDFNSVEGAYRRNDVGRTTRGARGQSRAGGPRCWTQVPCIRQGWALTALHFQQTGSMVGGEGRGKEEEEGIQEIEGREGGRKHESLGEIGSSRLSLPQEVRQTRRCLFPLPLLPLRAVGVRTMGMESFFPSHLAGLGPFPPCPTESNAFLS